MNGRGHLAGWSLFGDRAANLREVLHSPPVEKGGHLTSSGENLMGLLGRRLLGPNALNTETRAPQAHILIGYG